jgi:hypothetical protein
MIIVTMARVYLTRLPFVENQLAKAEGVKWDSGRKLWYAENPITHKACLRWCDDEASPWEDRDWRYFRFDDIEKAKMEKCRYSPEASAWWKPSPSERREYALKKQQEELQELARLVANEDV